MQTLNGKRRANDADSFAVDVGTWRHAIGNYSFAVDGGAQTAFTIFAVTGDVLLTVLGVCKALLDSGGAATVQLGIVGNTAALIALTTATDIDANETWQDVGPEANPGAVDVFGGARQFVVAGGADIILTVATANLTAGVLDFHCFWVPLSNDGAVVAA